MALLIPILALLIPIVAILATTYTKVVQEQNRAAERLGQATGHLDEALAAAEAERDRLRQRVEALEAIVTSEGYDLEREARAAGITGPPAGVVSARVGRIDADLLDAPAPADAPRADRRVRE
jgi:cell division septum initiation protein DivIVA